MGNNQGPRVKTLEWVKSRTLVTPEGCWLWTVHTTNAGYAQMAHDGTNVLVHRWMYEREVGPIPEGLVIDHLCRNRHCVNPACMEPVSRGENVLRGIGPSAEAARRTKCMSGHDYTPENTRTRVKGGRPTRVCRTCARRHNELSIARRAA